PHSKKQAGSELPKDYLEFFTALHNAFESRRQKLLALRAKVLADAQTGKMPVPNWALDQRNQITGPADNAKLLIGMCNSGAPGCMPDGEDSITTDWKN